MITLLLATALSLPCMDRTAWMDCTAAMSLPGKEHVPACVPGEKVMVSLRTQQDVELDAHFEVYDQRAPAECTRKADPDCEDTEEATCERVPIEVRPASERYPWCVVGRVQRVGDEDRPPLLPYVGVCCEVGCLCAGPECEHITLAPPRGYATDRLKRMGIQE